MTYMKLVEDLLPERADRTCLVRSLLLTCRICQEAACGVGITSMTSALRCACNGQDGS